MPRLLTALPIFNEEAHIQNVLAEVRRYSDDILVVDDGSSDKTAELLSQQKEISVITHPQNRGYGAALHSAFLYAIEHRYDVLVTIDCDGQHEPRLIPEIAAAIFEPTDSATKPVADIVSGSRYLKKFDGANSPPEERRQINLQITQLLNEQLQLQLTDSFCGFKAYRVAVLPQFRITEFGYAMPLQLWVQAVQANLRITEFPVPLVYLEEKRSFGGELDDGQSRIAYYQNVLKQEMAMSCE